MGTQRRRGLNRGWAVAAVSCLSVAGLIVGGLALELRGGRTAPGDLDPGHRLAEVYGENVVNTLFETVGGEQLPDESQLADTTLLVGDHAVTPDKWICAARARLTTKELRLVGAARVEYPGDREVPRRWEIDSRGAQVHVYTVSIFPKDVTGFDPAEAADVSVKGAAIVAGRKVFDGATVVVRGSGGRTDAMRTTTIRMPPGPTGTCSVNRSGER